MTMLVQHAAPPGRPDFIPQSIETANMPSNKVKNVHMNEPSELSPTGSSQSDEEKNIWNNMSVFKDFFLAAFSDGYHNACFCGDSIPACCESTSKTGNKSIPDDNTIRTSRSSVSHDTSLQHSPSQETRGSAKRRKKPLAVAVGFKYAEDQQGRPIVITPTGSRFLPIDLTDERHTPPRSPPSLPRLRDAGGSVSSGQLPVRLYPKGPQQIPPSPPRPMFPSSN